MVSSPLKRKSNLHSRSNSLPSWTHPLIPQIEGHLTRLISSSEATSYSSSSISKNLSGLKDVYELVDALLQLPHVEQALAQQCQDDEVLSGSLRLLDACGIAKDALLQAKTSTQELQSSIRRRRGDEVEFIQEVNEYLASRKKAKKSINKFVRDLKSKCGSTHLGNDTEAIVRMMREVERGTLSVVESLLSLISGPKMQSNSMISKLFHTKRVACEEEVLQSNDFANVDAALCTLISQTRKADNISAKKAQNELKKLESSIEDLEDGVEWLTRQLIKTRVYILNILSH